MLGSSGERGRSSNENLRVGRATLESDGEHTWLESDAPPSHPALLAPTDGPLPPAEAYKWDLCGHLVLRGVMDPAWIADALHAIDSNPNPDHPSAEGDTCVNDGHCKIILEQFYACY